MKIAASTTADLIADALRTALQQGRWAPGAALRQEDLAAEFGVSRIPVREALSKLQAEGLLTITPNRGAYVTTLTASELHEIYDLRVLLETDALRHAMPHHTARSLRQLEAIQRELDAEHALSAWIESDRAFHQALYAPSARSKTLALIATLRASVERFYRARQIPLTPETRRAGWKDEHHQLLDAVKAGDIEAAQEILTLHLRHTETAAVAALQALATGPSNANPE